MAQIYPKLNDENLRIVILSQNQRKILALQLAVLILSFTCGIDET